MVGGVARRRGSRLLPVRVGRRGVASGRGILRLLPAPATGIRAGSFAPAVELLQAQHRRGAGLASGGDRARGGDAGGERGEAGDAAGDGGAADLPAIGARARARGGVDDQVDVAALDPVEHVRPALGDLVERLRGDPHARDRLGGAACGEDPEAVLVQALGDREGARLIGIGDRDEHGAVQRQRAAGGGLRLGERGREVARDPHHLPGGAHLRAEHRVGALEAIERQHRLLDRDVVAEAEPFPLARQVQRAERLAQHHAAGELRQRQADGLGDEWHGARGPGVGLQHVQLPVDDGVLHVQQPDHADGQRELARGGADLIEHLAPQRVRRQHAGGVAGVHAGLLDVLHDPPDPHLFPVAQRVDVQLDRVLQEAVEEDFLIGMGHALCRLTGRGGDGGRGTGRPGDIARQIRGGSSRRR